MSSVREDDLPSPVYMTAYGDLKPNRESFVSINEAEHGWSSSANGVRSPQNRQTYRRNEPSPRLNDQPIKPAYRPPFAPRLGSLEGEVATVPTLASCPPGETKLNRGRSLKDTISGVIGGRGKSAGRQPREIVVVEEDEKVFNGKVDVEEARSQPPQAGTSPSKEGWASGIVRRMSRKNTAPTRRVRRSSADSPAMRLPTREELDNIPLYAAPPAAQVPNAPMLSSYAPRPPLLSRANTTDNVLTLQRSITVREARLAYAKSLKDKRRQPITPAASVGSANGERLMRQSRETLNLDEGQLAMKTKARRSKHNPEGWAPASEVLSEEKKD